MLKTLTTNINKTFGLIIVFFGLTFLSCESNPLEIDVSQINIQPQYRHFENDLFKKEANISNNDVEQLQSEYGIFFSDFTSQIINIGDERRSDFIFQLNRFKNDVNLNDVFSDVKKMYGDFSSIQPFITNAFKHYHYYFPEKEIPTIITYISGFNYAIATGENYLGIGLDMFLGSDYKAYDLLAIPKYKSRIMTKDYLVPSVMLGWISTEFEMPIAQPNLLEEMIHQGKILYLLDALLPQEEYYLKLSYTPEQYEWCEQNNKEIWFYFMDNDLLYTKESTQIVKYMGEAPFTQGFPEGSPGRVGHWLGWQIVKAYMKKNPKVSIPELMQEEDLQKILTKSKYKP